jgi:putative ABC transport system permease protein
MSADGSLVLPGAKPGISVHGMDLGGLAQGMLRFLEGRLPTGPTEVLISPATAELAGVGIGGKLSLDGGPTVTVVGLVEREAYLRDRIVLFDPRSVELGDPEFGSWLVDVPADVDPDTLVAAAIDPETGAPITPFAIESRNAGGLRVTGGGDAYSPTILVLGTLALVEAALIASAAFAVSIRRRQRELGLLAAAGATPGQLRATVLVEATVIGIIAAVIGIVVGLVGAVALSQVLDDLTQHRNGPLVVDGFGLLAPAAIGFMAAIIAALTPSRTASRVPVLIALSGRRPAVAPARRNLALGLIAVAASVAMTLIGANLREQGSDIASMALLVGGAVLGTLGFGACGPWLLERLEALAVRLPLAGRIAFRDTARARSRSSPIVTAVLASVAATVALGTFMVSRDAEMLEQWRPYLYPEQLMIRGAGAEAAATEATNLDGAVRSTRMPPDLYLPAPAWYGIVSPEARDAEGNVIQFGNEEFPQPFQVNEAVVATPDLLRLAHAEAATADVTAGKVVILWHEPITLDSVDVQFYDPDTAEVERTVRLEATVLVTPIGSGTYGGALMSQALADDLGLVPFPGNDSVDYVVEFDRPVTEADLAAVASVAAKYADTFADAPLAPERQDASFRLVMIALAILFAVSVTGIAIALGEAESRPEQRSLLALGADPRLRRQIAAARAAVLTLLAGALAVPAGLLPVWGLLMSREAPLTVPVLEIGSAVVVLPALAVLAAWLLSRPIPDWGAFRSVRPGE